MRITAISDGNDWKIQINPTTPEEVAAGPPTAAQMCIIFADLIKSVCEPQPAPIIALPRR